MNGIQDITMSPYQVNAIVDENRLHQKTNGAIVGGNLNFLSQRHSVIIRGKSHVYGILSLGNSETDYVFSFTHLPPLSNWRSWSSSLVIGLGPP